MCSGRRYPAADVLIYPTQVQGASAAATIAAALGRASERGDCDVLILARGGGSLEDLWSFNEEAVARAIRASQIPVVCGVGHETDFTIADFAADFRAPTPSAAAESVTPDREELLVRLQQLAARITHTWQRSERERRQAVTTLSQRLAIQHPHRRLQERALRLDELAERLSAAPLRQIVGLRSKLATLNSELNRHSPGLRIQRLHDQMARLDERLLRLWHLHAERRQARVKTLAARLHALGPEQTLARGYAIVFAADGPFCATHPVPAPATPFAPAWRMAAWMRLWSK